MSFQTDLSKGEQGESLVISYLVGKGAKLVSRNSTKDWDFIVNKDGVPISYEVKTDFYCTKNRDTGNFFIEITSRGKPSGITTSKADWMVFFMANLGKCYFIKRDALLRLLLMNEVKVKTGGDKGSRTFAYVLPRDKFKDDFLIVDL